MSELFVDGSLGERPLRSEETDLEGLLLCETRRHDLAKQAQHLVIAHRAFIALHNVTQHFGFTFRAVVVDGGA